MTVISNTTYQMFLVVSLSLEIALACISVIVVLICVIA